MSTIFLLPHSRLNSLVLCGIDIEATGSNAVEAGPETYFSGLI